MPGGGDGAIGVSPRRRAGIAVGVAAVAIVLVALVSTGGRVPLATEGGRGWELFIPNVPSQQLQPPAPARQQPVDGPKEVPGIGAIAMLAQVMIIMLAAALLVVSGRAVARNWRRLQREPSPVFPDAELVTRPDPLVDAIDDGIVAMAGGPVDDVIIECWVRLEDAAAEAGVARLPSETPSELAARVLADLDAPAASIAVLLDRYRTARYSHHRLDEEDRVVALRALQEIRDAIIGAPA
jgi:hypothetical protein